MEAMAILTLHRSWSDLHSATDNSDIQRVQGGVNILPFVARSHSDCVAHTIIGHFSEIGRRDQSTAIDTVMNLLEQLRPSEPLKPRFKYLWFKT